MLGAPPITVILIGFSGVLHADRILSVVTSVVVRMGLNRMLNSVV